MFETPQEIKPSAAKGLWAGIAVVAVAIGLSGYFIMAYKENKPAPAAALATSPSIASGDAIKDLKVQRTTMSKDRNETAVWVVTIENKSSSYTYSNIQYETTYVGADNNAILINKGTIPGAFSPGDQRNAEIKDVPYPAGTAWYKLKITGATASAQ